MYIEAFDQPSRRCATDRAGHAGAPPTGLIGTPLHAKNWRGAKYVIYAKNYMYIYIYMYRVRERERYRYLDICIYIYICYFG